MSHMVKNPEKIDRTELPWQFQLLGTVFGSVEHLGTARHDGKALALAIARGITGLVDDLDQTISRYEGERLANLTAGVDDTKEYTQTVALVHNWLTAATFLIQEGWAFVVQTAWESADIPIAKARFEVLLAKLESHAVLARQMLTPDDQFFGSPLFDLAAAASAEHARGETEPLLPLS